MKKYSEPKILSTDRLEKLSIRDEDLEQIILYCLLFDNDARKSINKIDKEDFANIGYKELFASLKEYIEEVGGNFDANTVPMKVRINRVYLSLFNKDHIITSNFNLYLKKLKEVSERRKLEEFAYDLTIMAREGKGLADIKLKMSEIAERINLNLNRRIKHIKEIDIDLEEHLEKNNTNFLSTGFKVLDKNIDGLHKGELYIIGGVPAVGKTTFALNILNNVCRQGKRVLFVSLEMPYMEIELKLISQITEISTKTIRYSSVGNTGELIKKIQNVRSTIYNYDLYLIGSEGVFTHDIDETLKNIGNIDVLFIDYLQRLKTVGGKDKYEKTSQISSELKTIATKFDVPVISIATINRAFAGRKSKKPILSDLRDSGNIEFDADTVIFLYRECQFKNSAPIDDIKIIIAKYSYGQSNVEIDMLWKPEKSKIEEIIQNQ